MSGNLATVTDFLEKIGATPAELFLCVGNAAASHIRNLSGTRKVTRGDLSAMREWVGTQVPEAIDRFTGEALADAAGLQIKMSFSEASDFAVEFAESSGNDDVLAAFLQSDAALSKKEQERALAGKISDETRRAAILKGLE